MFISDHQCTIFNCEIHTARTVLPRSNLTRNFKEQTPAKFCALLKPNSDASSIPSDTNELVSSFNSQSSSILDLIAPLSSRPKSMSIKQPWLDENIRACKRNFRKVEHACKNQVSRFTTWL